MHATATCFICVFALESAVSFHCKAAFVRTSHAEVVWMHS